MNTESQRQAIESRGNVLVVAGAGTGKTRTLITRCVEWLLEAPGRHSLDQILMVTFTEAAAAEMRHRIRAELTARLDQDPRQAHLTEQLALLDTAFISTLHSFCFYLVRQRFYELDLDPQVSILTQEETTLLADETLSAILEEHYGGTDAQAEAVRRLIQTQARGWDVPVKRLILRLHHYTQTLPDPAGWLRRQRELFAAPEPTQWRTWLHGLLPEWKAAWEPVIQHLGKDVPNLADCAAALAKLTSHPTLPQVRRAMEEIRAADQLPWPRGTKGTIRDPIDDFFEEAEFLRGLMTASLLPVEIAEASTALGEAASSTTELSCAGDDALAQDWHWGRTSMLTLLELTQEFGQRFADAKRDQGVVDFHDLEQFSLRLLWDPVLSSPTPLARQWRQRFELVFVDEYQDINAAQDAILRSLGGEDEAANRFLVGDPKQSIYRFRLADPHIFQRYAQDWFRDPALGRTVVLRENFRSREPILEFINGLIATVMKKGIGGVEFDELARLKFGDPQNRSAFGRDATISEAMSVPAVEVHLRLTGSKETGDSANGEGAPASQDLLAGISNAEKEARLIGRRLAELRERKHLIWDLEQKAYRPVDWSDMVILLRSPQLKAESYAKEFSRLGIPLIAARGGFFEHPEVADVLSLLTVLDNPIQDIPLLAVLRSPFAALTWDELALVRLAAKGRFWSALHRFHRLRRPGAMQTPVLHGEELPPRPVAALQDPALCTTSDRAWQKVDAFLARTKAWRRWMRETALSQALERILRDTQYEIFLMSHPRGPQQRGNVAKLLNWARRFDQFQRQGLYRFLKFIQAQRDAQIDHEPAPVQTENAVRLMSIHQSKGLEFEVVVLADLGKHFNLADLKADVILDEQFGLCPLIKPPFTEQRYPSLPYWLAQRRQRRELLGEEIRLLYVGLTRACQCLILSGTATAAAVGRWSKPAPLTEREILSATNYLDWIGAWMAQATGRPDWSQTPSGQGALCHWTLYEPDDARLELSPGAAEAVAPSEPLDSSLTSEATKALTQKLAWTYPFPDGVRQPAKVSVSSFRAGILAEVESDDDPPQRRRWNGMVSRKDGQLEASAIGTAHHSFLEGVSLEADLTDKASLDAEAQRLERAGILHAAERGCLDFPAIAAFWGSQTGQEILSHRAEIHRESPFTARLALEEAVRFRLDELRRLQPQGTPPAAMAKRETEGVRDGGACDTKQPVADAGSGVGHEYIILTGVVDLLVLLPQEIWILDFKTDAIVGEGWREKAKEYDPQMRLYALAVSRIYGRPVTRHWLHFLNARRTVEIV